MYEFKKKRPLVMGKHIWKTSAIVLLLFALVIPATGIAYSSNDECLPEADITYAVNEIIDCEHDDCNTFHSQEIFYFDESEVVSVEPILIINDIHSFYSKDLVLFGEPLAPELSELMEKLNFSTPPNNHCNGFTMAFVDHVVAWQDLDATSHCLVSATRWRCNGCYTVVTTYSIGANESHNWLAISHWHGTGNTHHGIDRCRQCLRTRTYTWTCPPGGCVTPFSLSVEYDE